MQIIVLLKLQDMQILMHPCDNAIIVLLMLNASVMVDLFVAIVCYPWKLHYLESIMTLIFESKMAFAPCF